MQQYMFSNHSLQLIVMIVPFFVTNKQKPKLIDCDMIDGTEMRQLLVFLSSDLLKSEATIRIKVSSSRLTKMDICLLVRSVQKHTGVI